MALALHKATTGEDPTIAEFQQFCSYVRAFLTNTEDTFLHHRHGLLEDAAFRGFQASLGNTFGLACFRVAWRSVRVAINPDYAAFIDQLIADTPLRHAPSSADQLAAWRSGIAEMLSNAA